MNFSRLSRIAALLLLAACHGVTEPGPSATPPTLDALPRQLSANEQKLVGSTNDFSFSLFRQLNSAQKDSNVFASPLSASMALGMTMNGAANTTYDQMKSA